MMSLPTKYLERFAAKGFKLVERIGSGLSGTVFRARQTSLDRDVAIKVFDNPFNGNDSKLRKRFIREAQLLARVTHSSIPVVLTRGSISVDGSEIPYTVLQLIEGVGLDQVISSDRRLSPRRAVEIASRVLAALSAAHRAKIVHRDVKPSNIMVHATTGDVWLIDFSIGVSLDAAPGLTRVTSEGGQPGTCEYMAPEQRGERDVDHRADIYSVGIVLFEMLVGHPRLKLDVLDADLVNVPIELRQIIRQACQPDPNERFESAEAFERALAPSRTTLRTREQASTALCVNVKCPDAQLTERGYYEGPRIVRETTDNCCQAAGPTSSIRASAAAGHSRRANSAAAAEIDSTRCRSVASAALG